MAEPSVVHDAMLSITSRAEARHERHAAAVREGAAICGVDCQNRQLRDNRIHHLPKHVRQAHVAAAEAEGEFGVVDA
jgi:hypothetical protein